MKRASLEQSAAEQMIAAQLPLAEKIARADHVIWNNRELSVLAAQAQLLAHFSITDGRECFSVDAHGRLAEVAECRPWISTNSRRSPRGLEELAGVSMCA